MVSDAKQLKLWRRRGYYTERQLVKRLEKLGFRAVRIPVSNPSANPLPDVIARKDLHIYAIECKNASYYAYFPKKQIEKLFRFLDLFIPLPRQYMHAVLVAHLGKRWIWKELDWEMYEKQKIPEKIAINHRSHTQLKL